MIALRSIAVVVLLASGPLPAWAQASLAAVDRDLNSLCLRLTKARAQDSAGTRARLAALWRRRLAIIENVPEPQRAAVLARSTLNPDCSVVAKAEAEPRGRDRKKRTRAFKNGDPPAGNGGAEPRVGETTRALRRSHAPAGNREAEPRVESSTDLSSISPPPATPAPAPLPTVRRGPASVPTVRREPTPMPTPAPTGPAAPGSSDRPDAAATLQEFSPWPPPAPSARQLLSLAQLDGGPPSASWGDVADRIVALLRSAQFPSWGFYAAPGGFAVLTRIEQLDHQAGVPLPGAQRWAQEIQLASTSILEGLLTTRRPQGLYRVIAFILTTDPQTGGEVTAPARMLQLARRWGVSGALDLPHALRANRISPDQRLFALVYEFESAIGGDTRVNSPGRWPLDAHLLTAGISVRR